MKKIILLSFIILSALTAFAGENEKRAKQIASNMESVLGLTKEQVKEICTITGKSLDNLQAKPENAQQQKRQYHSEIGRQLKVDQYNKWMEIRKEQLKLKKEGKEVKNPVIDGDLEYLN
jgi:hypothetical protein